MKNSIGSLAALAAFAIPAAVEAAPTVASFSNVPLPVGSSIDFDVDGDSTPDFYIYSNEFSLDVFVEGYGDTLFFSTPVAEGSLVTVGGPDNNFALIEDSGSPSISASYFGFTFSIGSQTHTGWLLADASGDPHLAVSGAWESVPGQSITVGAIPEPSAFAAIGGMTALGLAFTGRRRRPGATPAVA